MQPNRGQTRVPAVRDWTEGIWPRAFSACRFGHWNLGHWDLFRISCFEFRGGRMAMGCGQSPRQYIRKKIGGGATDELHPEYQRAVEAPNL